MAMKPPPVRAQAKSKSASKAAPSGKIPKMAAAVRKGAVRTNTGRAVKKGKR